jgi:hypothetical protein
MPGRPAGCSPVTQRAADRSGSGGGVIRAGPGSLNHQLHQLATVAASAENLQPDPPALVVAYRGRSTTHPRRLDKKWCRSSRPAPYHIRNCHYVNSSRYAHGDQTAQDHHRGPPPIPCPARRGRVSEGLRSTAAITLGKRRHRSADAVSCELYSDATPPPRDNRVYRLALARQRPLMPPPVIPAWTSEDR